MKKILGVVVILLLVFVVAVFVYANSDSGIQPEMTEEGDYYCNPYFYNLEKVQLSAEAEYYNEDGVPYEKVVDLEMYKVKEYESGELFHFRIGSIENGEGLYDARTNIYFYVTDDKIYRLWSYVYLGDDTITFYDDDEAAVSVLDTKAKIIGNAEVVCQTEEIYSDLEDGTYGMHYAITKNENQISYSRCYVKMNGDPGFYEWFTWEEGKGLVDYGSGYSAERDILYLKDIKIHP